MILLGYWVKLYMKYVWNKNAWLVSTKCEYKINI